MIEVGEKKINFDIKRDILSSLICYYKNKICYLFLYSRIYSAQLNKKLILILMDLLLFIFFSEKYVQRIVNKK